MAKGLFICFKMRILFKSEDTYIKCASFVVCCQTTEFAVHHQYTTCTCTEQTYLESLISFNEIKISYLCIGPYCDRQSINHNNALYISNYYIITYQQNACSHCRRDGLIRGGLQWQSINFLFSCIIVLAQAGQKNF